MKFDKAYCKELDEYVTIFEVRDKHFDEKEAFEAKENTYYCPDDICRAKMGERCRLTTVNATQRQYIKTPHFKDTPNTEHDPQCPYHSERETTPKPDPTKPVKEVFVCEKTYDYPVEFLPNPKVYTRKPKNTIATHEPEAFTLSSSSAIREITRQPPSFKPSGNKTGVFEHIVDGFIRYAQDKEVLQNMPLSIGEKKLSYWSFFKKIRFFQDREGLIYWGKIKAIRDYRYSFSVIFEDRVEGHMLTAYIKKQVIQDYRKKSLFLDNIRAASESVDGLYAFFYGAYPRMKTVNNNEKTFEVFNVEVEQLDHFLIKNMAQLPLQVVSNEFSSGK